MKVIVAITGASGAIYARQVLEILLNNKTVDRIALILSHHAPDVIKAEGITLPNDERITYYDNENMWASLASGSARWDAMIIVPASMGCVARVAAGVSRTLIERAADVMLKERRRLVVAVREAPYSLIHLRNMTTLTEAGAIVIPASPSFYFRPQSIEELCYNLSERIIEAAGIKVEHKEWGEEK
ncbi:MAG: UbiX family flavin prenyltransferase [Alistipes sp.]|nr:UbiX family flavin prenyltransferase [Alistipes sp.]